MQNYMYLSDRKFDLKMNIRDKKIILGSNSPRRKELLAGLDIDFAVDTRNDFEEVYDPSTPIERIPEVLSEGKSYGFWRELSEGEILITSDTLVLCGERVMGKPHSREEAVDMLRCLSGREHKVITAITLRDRARCSTLSDTAIVHFKELTDSEINYYIDTYHPFDKAGAYGIQEWIGYIGIGKIEGSYFTIMGLPVHLVYEGLLKMIQ
jgi:septum formation protein